MLIHDARKHWHPGVGPKVPLTPWGMSRESFLGRAVARLVLLLAMMRAGCYGCHSPQPVSLLAFDASMRGNRQTKEDIVNLNLGSADRKLRAFVVAPVFVIAGVLVGPAGWLAIVLYALAGVMLVTAAAGSCPLYSLFGLRTCPLQKAGTHGSERVASR